MYCVLTIKFVFLTCVDSTLVSELRPVTPTVQRYITCFPVVHRSEVLCLSKSRVRWMFVWLVGKQKNFR